MVDDATMTIIFSDTKLEEEFFKIAREAPSVCVCRCSPTHKSKIVSCVSKYTKKRTCAVGDGGNDVSMILEANVGIGIVGKEGKLCRSPLNFQLGSCLAALHVG